jgi:hypothetical protein
MGVATSMQINIHFQFDWYQKTQTPKAGMLTRSKNIQCFIGAFSPKPNACRNGGETAQRFCRPAPKGRIAGSC